MHLFIASGEYLLVFVINFQPLTIPIFESESFNDLLKSPSVINPINVNVFPC